MKKDKLLIETQLFKLWENAGLNVVRGANLITVDVQPEYEDYLGFNLENYLQFLNENIENLNSLTFLYNGADTLGMVSEQDFQYWLIENGFEEENLYGARYYDKGYAFFRYCMDEGIDDDEIVSLIQFMIRHNINDSRSIDEQMWIDFMTETNADQSDVKDLLEIADDMINIPDLMDFLKNYGGKIILTGGGINE